MSILAVYLIGAVLSVPLIGRLWAWFLRRDGISVSGGDAAMAVGAGLMWPIAFPAMVLAVAMSVAVTGSWTVPAGVKRVILGREAS